MDSLSTLVKLALAEDAAATDLTAQATIALEQSGSATLTAKANGVLSGIQVTRYVFESVDKNITQTWARQDGDDVHASDIICRISGPLRSLLAAERTALNFLQHLSGIATLTRAFVDTVAETGCAIADTRKTTPGLRHLEKQAVLHGGGVNHRMDLASGMLIKENHIVAAGSLSQAVHLCSESGYDVWVDVECETMDEVREAVSVCPDIILLDNMTPEAVRTTRAIVPKTILLEASGNITLSNAREYAETGVDRLAIGAITHSAPALDISMRVKAQ
ncbi:MAG: carboxylating nicotinate-nucleotide diphosphorylase [Mariprofundaceae bacterium]|nr:carboxylating nicotinate-nucleotide diphosphorylase [Mariprofundaceae bacterium]